MDYTILMNVQNIANSVPIIAIFIIISIVKGCS